MKVKKLNGKSNVLGKNVKKYRELRHLTQRELSDKIALLGVDIYHSDISQIENQRINERKRYFNLQIRNSYRSI